MFEHSSCEGIPVGKENPWKQSNNKHSQFGNYFMVVCSAAHTQIAFMLLTKKGMLVCSQALEMVLENFGSTAHLLE